MMLIRIVHDRCNEYDGTDYVLAPEDWDLNKISSLIDDTKNEMIEDAKKFKENIPYPYSPPYKDHPDKTVKEVQALWEDQKKEYKERAEKNSRLKRSLIERLEEKGFSSIWNNPEIDEITVYWGHNHGLDLNYTHSNF